MLAELNVSVGRVVVAGRGFSDFGLLLDTFLAVVIGVVAGGEVVAIGVVTVDSGITSGDSVVVVVLVVVVVVVVATVDTVSGVVDVVVVDAVVATVAVIGRGPSLWKNNT